MGSCDGFYSGTVAALSSQDKTNIRQFIEAQLDAFEEAAGWIWWTWKTQGAPEWDMQDLINNGVFPQPLTSRKCKLLPGLKSHSVTDNPSRPWPMWLKHTIPYLVPIHHLTSVSSPYRLVQTTRV